MANILSVTLLLLLKMIVGDRNFGVVTGFVYEHLRTLNDKKQPLLFIGDSSVVEVLLTEFDFKKAICGKTRNKPIMGFRCHLVKYFEIELLLVKHLKKFAVQKFWMKRLKYSY